MKKVYFAGSIRGGRQDAELYKKIIDKLSEKHKVLTEHVGAKTIDEMGEQGMTDEDIYTRDIMWIKEADFVVAEVTTTSLGVGYEIAFAENLDKPIYCLYRKQNGKKLSAMLTGNKNLHITQYETEAEVLDAVSKL